ncbi:zinc finger protein 280D-like isoform X2 [Limulus polyphemus]|uniref:Zinc finger protein 280D-like isoform X2 n=1 Tax=Limulus polyphemus TaxID=6850 RepID=A0ABM1T582_LIMPO|nr:zinc finger protein 280D-like isoform X2 [Limulus polyphemus]
MKPRENEKIVMLKDPHIKPTRISKVRVEPSTSEALLSPAALEEKYMDIIFNDDTSQLSCVECTERIDDEHFRRCLSCSQCRYATNCGKAFVEHMIVHHSKLKKKRPSLINLKPTYCQRPMFCICGYNTINGNDLARHLAICHKRSCYISRAKALAATIKKEEATIQLQPQSAFFPPLVVLDENEEKSINDSFARVHTRRSTATSTQVALESSVPISQKILNVSKEVCQRTSSMSIGQTIQHTHSVTIPQELATGTMRPL